MQWNANTDAAIERLAIRTPLHVYESLKKLISETVTGIKITNAATFVSEVTIALNSVDPSPPEIRLRSYESRFDIAEPQWPAEEFLRLCLLRGEVDPEDHDAKKRFTALAKRWKKKNPEEYADRLPSLKAEMERCGLKKWEIPES